MDSSILPSNIRKYREAAGWSQTDLAAKLGITQGAVAHYETGRNTPSIQRVMHLARLFDVPMEALLTPNGSSTHCITK